MDRRPEAAGAAAPSICESLLLRLIDRGVLTGSDLAGLLDNSAADHRRPGRTGDRSARDTDAGVLIATIVAGSDALRRRGPGPGPDAD